MFFVPVCFKPCDVSLDFCSCCWLSSSNQDCWWHRVTCFLCASSSVVVIFTQMQKATWRKSVLIFKLHAVTRFKWFKTRQKVHNQFTALQCKQSAYFKNLYSCVLHQKFPQVAKSFCKAWKTEKLWFRSLSLIKVSKRKTFRWCSV